MTLFIKNLSIYNSQNEALFSPLNIQVNNGEILTLMGPSGCGKSTLLDAIAGHLSSKFTYTGSVLLNNVPLDALPAHQRSVGILFQEDLLFPHLNVWENLAFALPNTIKREDRNQQAIQALRHLSLTKLANYFPDQLSGGQRARISLVRMLLAQPNLALLDEPFSKLNKELREEFRDWVVAQLKAADIPTILVTHDEADIPQGSQLLTWPFEVSHA